ncbi:MAG: hypothetical protein AB7I01_07585 [Gammaproteobacteria bacterium]
MWQYLKYLLLGKAVLITQGPVDLGPDWQRLTPPGALSALNDGAWISIHMNAAAELPPTPGARKVLLEARHPKGCVRVRMQSDDDVNVMLRNVGAEATPDDAFLVVLPGKAIPRKEVFNRVWVRATCPLEHVTVQWWNGAKPGDK